MALCPTATCSLFLIIKISTLKIIHSSLRNLKFVGINCRQFDAVVVTNYLWRPLFPTLLASLAAGGVLIYEAYTFREKDRDPAKRADPLSDNYLKEQELIRLFPGMRVLKYEEPLHEKEFRSSIILMKE